jgi:NAD(P)-dependent dehydrogenase (short-subunit alcohol dehydrogenase family)
MPRTIVTVGYGPGVSNAVAERFGAEGFAVGIVARSEASLAAGVKALAAKGVTAAAFAADAGQPESIRAAIARASEAMGPISVLHWNAISGGDAGDLLAAEPAAVGRVFDVAVAGLVAAVREALPDLKANQGALLVTNGAFGEDNPFIDAMAVNLKSMGVAVSNAAKHKLVGMLAEQLKADGVYVGEVTIAGAVKGTPFDNGSVPAIDPAAIAAKFWALYQGRSEIRDRIQ